MSCLGLYGVLLSRHSSDCKLGHKISFCEARLQAHQRQRKSIALHVLHLQLQLPCLDKTCCQHTVTAFLVTMSSGSGPDDWQERVMAQMYCAMGIGPPVDMSVPGGVTYMPSVWDSPGGVRVDRGLGVLLAEDVMGTDFVRQAAPDALEQVVFPESPTSAVAAATPTRSSAALCSPHEECIVCHDPLPGEGGAQTGCRALACRHRFHEACWSRWLHHNRTCPVCRRAVPEPAMQRPRRLIPDASTPLFTCIHY